MKLHIISSDVPFPPDYGGMVDVFYKIRNLYEAGVEIYLHCFTYGRGTPADLQPYCREVYYYRRKTGLAGFSAFLPYMMYSRRDKDLLRNLRQTEAPILFEGVHTTYYLAHPALAARFKLMRNQNLEQDYYRQLARREKNPLKKLYYTIESLLLKRQEARLDAADVFLTVALHDHAFFKQAYPGKHHEYLPSFQPYNDVAVSAGKGNYVLYHGNLGHPENVEAALFLLEKVCPHTDQPFIFAGKDPSPEIAAACAALPNCVLTANPSMQDMEQLVAGAQLHILPTFQATGLKLKLLHALFRGRHVVVNGAMVAGTGLEELCHIAETPGQFTAILQELMAVPFTEEAIRRRRDLLLQQYNNVQNAARIRTYLQS